MDLFFILIHVCFFSLILANFFMIKLAGFITVVLAQIAFFSLNLALTFSYYSVSLDLLFIYFFYIVLVCVGILYTFHFAFKFNLDHFSYRLDHVFNFIKGVTFQIAPPYAIYLFFSNELIFSYTEIRTFFGG